MQSIHNLKSVAASRRYYQAQRVKMNMRIRIGTRGPRPRCQGCRRLFHKDPGPVLYDRFWMRIMKHDHEVICHACVVRRLGPIIGYYHIVHCPWNTVWTEDLTYVIGSRIPSWWRGPNHVRLAWVGQYVYDEAKVVRVAYAAEAALVARDELLAKRAVRRPACSRRGTGRTD